jgi:hypothetical protein
MFDVSKAASKIKMPDLSTGQFENKTLSIINRVRPILIATFCTTEKTKLDQRPNPDDEHQAPCELTDQSQICYYAIFINASYDVVQTKEAYDGRKNGRRKEHPFHPAGMVAVTQPFAR